MFCSCLDGGSCAKILALRAGIQNPSGNFILKDINLLSWFLLFFCLSNGSHNLFCFMNEISAFFLSRVQFLCWFLLFYLIFFSLSWFCCLSWNCFCPYWWNEPKDHHVVSVPWRLVCKFLSSIQSIFFIFLLRFLKVEVCLFSKHLGRKGEREREREERERGGGGGGSKVLSFVFLRRRNKEKQCFLSN